MLHISSAPAAMTRSVQQDEVLAGRTPLCAHTLVREEFTFPDRLTLNRERSTNHRGKNTQIRIFGLPGGLL